MKEKEKVLFITSINILKHLERNSINKLLFRKKLLRDMYIKLKILQVEDIRPIVIS